MDLPMKNSAMVLSLIRNVSHCSHMLMTENKVPVAAKQVLECLHSTEHTSIQLATMSCHHIWILISLWHHFSSNKFNCVHNICNKESGDHCHRAGLNQYNHPRGKCLCSSRPPYFDYGFDSGLEEACCECILQLSQYEWPGGGSWAL